MERKIDVKAVGVGAGTILEVPVSVEHSDDEAAGHDFEFGGLRVGYRAGGSEEPKDGKQRCESPASVKNHTSPCKMASGSNWRQPESGRSRYAAMPGPARFIAKDVNNGC
jgi:hypothetical protein